MVVVCKMVNLVERGVGEVCRRGGLRGPLKAAVVAKPRVASVVPPFEASFEGLGEGRCRDPMMGPPASRRAETGGLQVGLGVSYRRGRGMS